MITRRELEEAIEECEKMPVSFQNCQKIATFYTIYDHLYGDKALSNAEIATNDVIGSYGNSEFLKKVEGKEGNGVWALLNELMDALQALDPALYRNFMSKL